MTKRLEAKGAAHLPKNAKRDLEIHGEGLRKGKEQSGGVHNTSKFKVIKEDDTDITMLKLNEVRCN